MATISKEETSHIAYLSYIRVDEKNLHALVPQLESVLSYAVCVKEVRGMIVSIETSLKENRTRKDEIKIIVQPELLLEEVPEREGTLILVPMILEQTFKI